MTTSSHAELASGPSVGNLRAYRRARHLARDVYHITRRPPLRQLPILRAELRRAADEVPRATARAWRSRFEPHRFQQARDAALDAAARLRYWLRVSEALGYVPDGEQCGLHRELRHVHRLLRRLTR